MIKIYQKKLSDNKVVQLSDFKTGCWIFANDLTDSEFAFLEERFKIDPVALRDSHDPYEVPRVEIDDGLIYIFTRVPQRINEKIITFPMLIIIGHNFILTVSKEFNQILTNFIDGKIDFTTTQKTQLVLKFLSEIMKSYGIFLSSISKEVRSTTDSFSRINENIIINFVRFEEVLNDFLLGLTHTKPALQKLTSGKLIQLYKEDHELIEDLVQNTEQLIELSVSTLKNIVNIRKGYSTIITNDLNKVIRLFTSLTVILTIPTIIASLYGMNVALPLANSSYAFLFIIVFIVFIISFVFYIFYHNRWL